jgi:two-component system OmpR family sensor kinase
MNSIRRTLLLWLSVGMSSAILIAAILIYFQAREEANQVFDYQMKQVVASLPAQAFSPLGPTPNDEANEQRDVVIQIWDSKGLRIYRSHEHTALPDRAELGFSNISARGMDWRVYSAQIGSTIVQVAQPLSDRRQLAAEMALKTVAPLFLLLPFLAILIWITIGRGLASIKRAAKDVELRDARSLAPISDSGVPQEIRPLTSALNDLLQRLDLAIGAQRTFVADAAHELKTPLTALNLQIQLAERADNVEERQVAFADLRKGLERANHLVHQLLTLARQEPGTVESDQEEIDLVALAQRVVSEFAGLAYLRRTDLGISKCMAASVIGNMDALRTLLNNLIDNAIRYSPEGSRIDVSVTSDQHDVSLTVADNGPGILPRELDRIFDRFYRIPGTPSSGSGLGLAIVKQIAIAHGARIDLDNSERGLSVCVKFPISALPNGKNVQ